MLIKLITKTLILTFLPNLLWAHDVRPKTDFRSMRPSTQYNETPQINKNDGQDGIPSYELEFNYRGNLKAFFTFEKRPFVMEEVTMYIQFKDANTLQPVDIRTVPEVTLYMPQIDMQHGSLPTVVTPRQNSNGTVLPGEFKVTNMYFIMGGDWDVQIALGGFLFGDNQKFVIQFDPDSGGCISHTINN